MINWLRIGFKSRKLGKTKKNSWPFSIKYESGICFVGINFIHSINFWDDKIK
ncbi:hypothetical protein SKUN_00448 [Spiroplasma kunkelii CR2-3x]|uniref:Uncharacterized protein n=1 Tax=Spiroplasma kunkelii CR2-3x TaxID=273035 RepID=A0A0K2JGJ6_SPIKU|nr:hypothetical protein SKUN_00448 [Spiroplasma kunkelii CR2-3x]